jgi:hypothetical protein
MSLVYGRDPLGKTVPLLVDANGAAICAAVDAGGVYHVIKLDAAGYIIPAGVDPFGFSHKLRTDLSGRLVVSGENPVGLGVPLQTDATGRLIVDGQDVGLTPRTLRTDASGRAIIAGEDSGLTPRTLRTEAAGRPETAMHHYTGGVWGKQPVVYGYTSEQMEAVNYTMPAAGSYTWFGTVVPANTLYTLKAFSVKDITSACGFISLLVYDGVNATAIKQILAPAANSWVFWDGAVDLAPGWRVSAVVNTALIADVLNFRAVYTIMTLNM